mgnify:CR=1 FL=1
MFKESFLDKILYLIKKLIPRSVFEFFQPMYHSMLAYAGAMWYGNPSKDLKIIGITGTKGKSTVTYMVSKLFEANGDAIAAIGSLGYKIKDKEWPNTLKMTMPGRFKLQKFFAEAKKAGCKYVVLEVTSEGIKQKRHLGVRFDCAVFLNLHKEHIESHGSFENYKLVKQELFKNTSNVHVLNADDPYVEDFSKFLSKRKIFFGLSRGDMVAKNINYTSEGSIFDIYGTQFNIHLAGEFNVLNCLAALAVVAMYGIDLPKAKPILESIKEIPGRMQYIQREPFAVVVDYAHTPDSLELVYRTLKAYQLTSLPARKLICVLGAAGGGRDKWKRKEFGRIAEQYCDEIILTNEDPYDEIPEKIIEEIFSGISSSSKPEKPSGPRAFTGFQSPKSPVGLGPLLGFKVHKIIDRREAIKKAISDARPGDTVIITGKGSETSMAVSGNKKIPWSDKKIVEEILLQHLQS